jgi:uncharacterized protein (DUF983 family)
MASETKVTRGFSCPCPKCGDDTVTVQLADVSQLHCTGCEEDLDLDDIRALVEGWGRVLAWLDTAPVYGE